MGPASAMQRLLLWGCYAAAFLFMLSYAAVFDDAYITFRVADHFMEGYGLRWNIDERVQVTTHPLWLLINIPYFVVFDDPYLPCIILSALLAVGAMRLALKNMPSALSGVMLVLLPFCASATLQRYTICGLEEPLGFLCLAWFMHEWLDKKRAGRLFFIASLVVLTRFDNALLVAPVLMFLLWQQRSPVKFAFAMWPLIGWLAFSLFYYGSFMPNTFHAKLANGVPRAEMVMQGFHYLQNFILFDPLLAGTISGAVVLAFCKGDAFTRLMGAGVGLHVAYTLYAGGDYMSGRFFAPSGFVALLLVARWWTARQWRVVPVGVVAVLLLHQWVVLPNAGLADWRKNHGINDHHAIYYAKNGLLSDPDHWLRRTVGVPSIVPDQAVWVYGSVGYQGYFAPDGMIIIDPYGLTDPLLARLPAKSGSRIGHFSRPLPEGYVQARETGDLSAMDEPLGLYYQKLRLITSGGLWDAERLKAILEFQLGRYDHWLEAGR
jgi:arabinofuranosyltransferase